MTDWHSWAPTDWAIVPILILSVSQRDSLFRYAALYLAGAIGMVWATVYRAGKGAA